MRVATAPTVHQTPHRYNRRRRTGLLVHESDERSDRGTRDDATHGDHPHGGHDHGGTRPRRPCRDVPPEVLAEPPPDTADGGVQPHVPGPARLHRADDPGAPLDRPGLRRRGVPLRRAGVPEGRVERAEGPQTRDDAVDLDGPARGVGCLDRQRDRLARHRPLVRARHAGHDHAAGSLARDAGHRPGPRRARVVGRAAPRRRRTGGRRRRAW